MQLNEYSIHFLQDEHGHHQVIKTLFHHGMDAGYLTKVLKGSIRRRNVGLTVLLREKMEINQEGAIGIVYIMHYSINRSLARSKAPSEASSTSDVTVTGSAHTT